jgi:hypothetical protein
MVPDEVVQIPEILHTYPEPSRAAISSGRCCSR